MARLVIATRGSNLALAQAKWVASRLEAARPGLKVELSIIKTKGDKILDVPLAKVGGKGLFVKEIEDALLEGRADLAVHSMKDMPAELPEGLVMAAVSEREDPRDVFVPNGGNKFEELPFGARVGTSSLRRQAQLLLVRPDLEMHSLRGNVETRLRKLKEENLDGIVLAAAGLSRLGIEVDAQVLPAEVMLPAVGQGALGLECRGDDEDTLALARSLADPDTADTVAAERAFLARLEGGCQVPIAGFAEMEGDKVRLEGLVAAIDGSRVVRVSRAAPRSEAAGLGVEVAELVLERGGRSILQEVYGEAPA